MSYLEATNVVKIISNKLVLNQVSFAVEKGNTLAIIGPSGSGKSTLLRALARLTPLDDGSLVYDGTLVSDPQLSRSVGPRIGMIFQSFNLFPHLSVARNISVPLRKVRKVNADTARTQAFLALDQVGLADFGDVRPDKLSGGQRQRVAIARALALEPDILLCDEITASLDPELSIEVLELLEKLSLGGLTIILATHELGFAHHVADHILMLEEGSVVECSSNEEFFHPNHHNLRVRSFLSAARKFAY